MTFRNTAGILCSCALAITLLADEVTFKPQQRRWWAIQPVVSPVLPELDAAGRSWAQNPIDHFIYQKLQAKNLKPSSPASRETYIRRVTFDMTGLPPSPVEVQAFLGDSQPGAEERLVDRILASPAYGERWGRHWLDVVRYADSDGFKQDDTRPNMWRYRDWVINSFNQDKPYDRFIKEQIAADELYPGDLNALPGLGFLRLFEDEFNQAHVRLRRQELLNDLTDNTAYAFMGVTLACARCHDHKFDPLLHKDYYRLQAHFANLRIIDDATLVPPSKVQEHSTQMARYREIAKPTLEKIEALMQGPRANFRKQYTERLPEEVQAIIAMPAKDRSPIQHQIYYKAVTQIEVPDAEVIPKFLDAAGKAKYKALMAELDNYKQHLPAPLPVAQIMRDQAAIAPPTFILRGGSIDQPGDEVAPGLLSILNPAPSKFTTIPNQDSSGRRSALALALADPSNPLTTRVMVNRVWHYHFGRGIVGTPNDFGVMGERPSHREMLDWLTHTFTTTDGWSLKKLHRRILLSATYRQSSSNNVEAAAVDPDNKLLWRYPRRRLEAESIRDSMLFVSGLLDPTMGGPGVFPTAPAGTEIQEGRHWKKSRGTQDEYRRSVYIFARRLVRYPMLESFDAPLAFESCGRRQQTVTADQALELLNGSATHNFARALADRIGNDEGQSHDSLASRAYSLTLGRSPSSLELSRATAFLKEQSALSGGRAAALQDLAQTLLASSEFLYVD
ncbi:MAG: DUF1553 domain-containing protein [Acidobacteria bacterium]|nr:DUF1553 domain-containing protein [Acidobacteriota bacterium]